MMNRIRCPICTLTYTKNNKTHHERTSYHCAFKNGDPELLRVYKDTHLSDDMRKSAYQQLLRNNPGP